MAFFDFRFKPYRQLLNNPPELDTGEPSIEIDQSRTTFNAAEITEYGVAILVDGKKYDFQSTLIGNIDLVSTDLSDALDNTTIKSFKLIWKGEGSVTAKDFRVSLAEFQALGGPDELSKLGSDIVWGTEFNDYLNPANGNDEIKGFGGDDSIVGGAGRDKVVFRGTLDDYTINSHDNSFTILDNRIQSPDGKDTVSDVEIFEFSDRTLSAVELNKFVNERSEPAPEPTPAPTTAPTLEPDTAADSNQMYGTQGKDKLIASTLSMSIDGMEGNDKITGSNGDDTLIGGAGNDKLAGRGGKDQFICLEGKDVIKDYDFDEGDSIEVIGNFTISKRKKHSLIRHDGGTVLVKKSIPGNVIVNNGKSAQNNSTSSTPTNPNYLELARRSPLPSKKGNIKGTAEDDIIEVQRYYEDAYLFDKVKIGVGSDRLIFDKTPSYISSRNGVEKLSSATYWLSEFDPLTGDKLLFDSSAYNKYDNTLATASSKNEVFTMAQTNTSFIRYGNHLYYNKNGAEQGLSIDYVGRIAEWDAQLIYFDNRNKNLDSLSDAIEFIKI